MCTKDVVVKGRCDRSDRSSPFYMNKQLLTAPLLHPTRARLYTPLAFNSSKVASCDRRKPTHLAGQHRFDVPKMRGRAKLPSTNRPFEPQR